MIKTLTVSTDITAVEVSGGAHVIITNRSDNATVYVSLAQDFSPDGDGVKAIDAGTADIFRNVGICTTTDGVSDWFGTLYFSADGAAKVQLESTANANFRHKKKGGDSGTLVLIQSKNLVGNMSYCANNDYYLGTYTIKNEEDD